MEYGILEVLSLVRIGYKKTKAPHLGYSPIILRNVL